MARATVGPASAPESGSAESGPALRRAVWWSIGWLVLGLAAGGVLLALLGSDRAVDYWTVYLVERSLSLDNVFLFLLILGYFSVPAPSQRKVLLIGIALALALRAVAIVVGAELIERFSVVTYVLGGLLLLVALRMLRGTNEEVDPERNPLVRLVRRFVPFTDREDTGRFVVREEGRLMATPLALALVAIAAADVTFAVDSIPAAFGITEDALIIWLANAFALLGLTSLFVLVRALVRRFRYMAQTLAAVLVFIALRLLTEDLVHLPELASLAGVLGLLAGGVVLSVLADRRDPPQPREEAERRPPRCPPQLGPPGAARAS